LEYIKKLGEKARKLIRRYNEKDFRVSREEFPYGKAVALLTAFAFLLRMFIAGNYISSFDTEWNIMWAVQLGDGFFNAHSHVYELDYPPLYFYPLWIVGRLIDKPWIGNYAPFRMMAIKFFPCLSDSLTIAAIWRLAGKRNKPLGLLAAGIWALNPACIVNCACWGQTDCVLMLLAALLMLALEEKHVVAAGVLWGAMCSTKLQGLYLTPVVGMEVLTICFGSLHPKDFSIKKVTKEQVKRFVRFALAALDTLIVVYLPFMIGSAMSRYRSGIGFWERLFKPISVYGEGLDKYPYITLNADNLYMLLGQNGVKDDLKLLPGLTAGRLGSLFLLLGMALVVVVYVFGRRRNHWLAGYMFMEIVFMLTCRQHERYQIITLVLLIFAVVKLEDRRLLRLFCLSSLVIFFNQHRVLAYARELAGWYNYYLYTNGHAEWPDKQNDFSGVNAFFNLCLFLFSMFYAVRFFTAGKREESAIREKE
jgi:Predicted integral membrane protein